MKLKLGLTAATLSAGKHYGRHSAHTHTQTGRQAAPLAVRVLASSCPKSFVLSAEKLQHPRARNIAGVCSA